MKHDPLLTTLLDLDFALQSQPKLIIGWGYGLYLKQIYLSAHPELQTLYYYAEFIFNSRRTLGGYVHCIHCRPPNHGASMPFSTRSSPYLVKSD